MKNRRKPIKTKSETSKTVRNIIARKTYIDQNFQRRSCWESEDKQSFMDALSYGFNINPIIEADIYKCLEYSKEQGIDVSVFIERLNQGSRFISVDGQNRSKTLKAYRNSEFRSDAFSEDGRSKYFSELTKKEQDTFLNTKVPVTDITGATYSDLSVIFKAVNSGLGLNRMELRNSIATALSPFVRLLSDQYCAEQKDIVDFEDELLLNNVESITKSRMKDCDTILKTICFLHDSPLGGLNLAGGQKGLSFNDNALDLFYQFGVGKGMSVDKVYGQGFEAKCEEMLEWLQSVVRCAPLAPKRKKGGQLRENTPLPFYWALCAVYCAIQDKDNKGHPGVQELVKLADDWRQYDGFTSREDVFYQVVKTVHNYQTAVSSKKYGDDMKRGKVSKGDYYCYFSTDVKDSQKREKVASTLLAQVGDDKLSALDSAVLHARQTRPKKLPVSA